MSITKLSIAVAVRLPSTSRLHHNVHCLAVAFPSSSLFYCHCRCTVNTLLLAGLLLSSRPLPLTSRHHHNVHPRSVAPPSSHLFHCCYHRAVHPLPLRCVKPSISINVPSLEIDTTLAVVLSIHCRLLSRLCQAVHCCCAALPSQRPSPIRHAAFKPSISLSLLLRCPSIVVASCQAVHLH
jgi:hypothetical protein